MEEIIRLSVPSCEYKKTERIRLMFQRIERWVGGEALKSLVELFGGKFIDGSLGERIEHLNRFAEVWDYRKKLAEDQKVNERWNICDDDFVAKNAKIIFEYSRGMGLVESFLPVFQPDYILPLGGARYSNYERPLHAKKLIDKWGENPGSIVALSGTRPINKREREAIDSYALNATTEYDAINAGIEKAFGLKCLYSECKDENENINLCSCIRKYDQSYMEYQIYSVAAPSKDAQRRANSRDTFEYFIEKFDISKKKILLVTTQIYVPYQLFKFADLAIENDFDVDCVGVGMDMMSKYSKSSNYLQEIKSTINAIAALYQKYEHVISDK